MVSSYALLEATVLLPNGDEEKRHVFTKLFLYEIVYILRGSTDQVWSFSLGIRSFHG